MTTYPHDLVFTLPPDSRYRLAVEAAAKELGLRIVVDSNDVIHVTVTSPGEAFHFGEETEAHLEATRP